MTAPVGVWDRSTPESDIGAVIDALRRSPDGADALAALLPERLPLYERRSAAEMTRLRGYLLAAFADTGLPDAAMPYVLEALETGHVAYEIAGAAIGARGLSHPPADIEASLLRAIDNLNGIDATVSFERYKPAWPYLQPTTALTELVKTIGQFRAHAPLALAKLGRLAHQPQLLSATVRQAIQDVLNTAPDTHDGDAVGGSETCGCAPAVDPSPGSCCAIPGDTPLRAELQDQDGRTERFETFFRGKPAVIAFFYTRCDNPYKCSLTITKLAALQTALHQRGLGDLVKIAAITYDPDFDLPNRLKLYGNDRGITFGDDARFFRATAGFQQLRQRFALGVNYGTSTVNRHPTEVYVLAEDGSVAASFTRRRWDVDTLYPAIEQLLHNASHH